MFESVFLLLDEDEDDPTFWPGAVIPSCFERNDGRTLFAPLVLTGTGEAINEQKALIELGHYRQPRLKVVLEYDVFLLSMRI
jgi:hypothetical protein